MHNDEDREAYRPIKGTEFATVLLGEIRARPTYRLVRVQLRAQRRSSAQRAVVCRAPRHRGTSRARRSIRRRGGSSTRSSAGSGDPGPEPDGAEDRPPLPLERVLAARRLLALRRDDPAARIERALAAQRLHALAKKRGSA